MFNRLAKPLLTNSFFLFGARGTGKTKLLETLFQKIPHLSLDFLDDTIARNFRRKPSSLKSQFLSFQAEKKSKWIVLDEVQKVSKILNTVHQMIEKEGTLFALSGSSARKLKRGNANLLAGRAFVYHLFPLTFFEMGKEFNLAEVLCYGSLPKLFSLKSEQEKKKYLKSYVQTYVKEEIIMEQLVRNLDPFQDFLQVSAQMSSKVINYSNIAKDVGVDPKTVLKYFNILEETWMGFKLNGYHTSVRKAQLYSPKFYWFDIGVRRTLEENLDYKPAPGTSYYGECFEELVINEIYRINHYTEKNYRMSYLATSNSAVEVDLVLDRGRGREVLLIEIKSAQKIDEQKVKHLSKVAESFKNAKCYYLSQTETSELIGNVHCLPWQKGIAKIFELS